MRLPRTAVVVAYSQLISLASQAMTEAMPALSQQVNGWRMRTIDMPWASRMLLLRGGEALTLLLDY